MKDSQKDVSVELARIIACLFVICIHISLGFYVCGQLSFSAVFLGCIRADGVALFWLISGAFFFGSKSYAKTMKSMVRRILIPVLLLWLLIMNVNGFLFEHQSVRESLVFDPRVYLNAIKTALCEWATPLPHSGQLWYVFAYILLCIVSPVLKAFVNDLDHNSRAERAFLIISFLLFLHNDVSGNHFAGFSHHGFDAAVPSAVIMIWGHIVYRYKDEILLKIKPGYFLLSFLVVSVIRSVLLFRLMREDPANNTIIFWYSSFAVICTVSLFLSLYGLTGSISSQSTARRVICYAGSHTFNIYLLHELVIDFMNANEWLSELQLRIETIDNVLVSQSLYYCLGSMIIFSICFLFSIFIRFLAAGCSKARLMICDRQ